ncbi:hypothetical protein Tco_0900264 [Tanacetum coccineum]
MPSSVTADVPEIYMQQFWYSVKKVKKSSFYEFDLDEKKCRVDVELFMKILDICPRVQGEEFIVPPSKEELLTFLIELGYKGQQNHIASMFGMFHKENVEFAELIWEDFQYQIDYRQSKLRRRKIMPYLRFTKIIINYFLSQHKSLTKKKHSHINTIKDDGVLNRLKFVRIGEDVQEYGRAIPDMMLADEIKQSEAYKAFIGYSTGLVPPKKTRGKGLKGKKAAVTPKKKSLISADDNIIPEPETHEHLVTEKPASEKDSDESEDNMQAIKASRKISRSQPHTRGSSEGAGITPEVPNESAGIFTTLSEGTGITPGVPNEEKYNSKAKVDSAIDWGSENESDYFKEDKTEDEDKEMKDAEDDETGKDDVAKSNAEKTEKVKGANKQAGIKVASVDQAKDTSAQDNQATALVYETSKEMPELPPTSSILSSPTLLNVHVSVNLEQPVPAPSPALTTETPISMVLSHPPYVTTITLVQQTTPIPTPPITSTTQLVTSPLPATETPNAPVPPSKVLTVVLQRVSTLEKDVKELKQVDHSVVIFKSIRSQVPPTVNEFLGSSLGDTLQKCSKNILKNSSKNLSNEDLIAESDQGKDKKRPRKYAQSSKKSSASKESSKGNTLPKTSKSGKSVTAEEPDEEHVHEVSMDAEENIVYEMGNVEEKFDGEVAPKIDNAPKNDWFKQPPRPPTPNPEWNKC